MDRMERHSAHYICGLDELAVAPLGAMARIVSILEPEAPAPPELANEGVPILELRFDDVIEPRGAAVPPTRADIERLLAFDQHHVPGERLLIHCRAGISRSTAALAVVLARRAPAHLSTLFAELRVVRPMAWPNSLMVMLGDGLLGLEGRLVRELREHYKFQLHARPSLGRMMIALGREREIPFEGFPRDPTVP